MSTVKISELPVLVSPDPADEFVVVDDSAGVTKKTTGVYNQANVVGTVSESGGDVTGAVIERGSNANGEYVKFADGTMICTRVLSDTQLESVSTSIAATNFNYPASFASSEPAVGFGLHGDAVFNPQGFDTLDTITISARDLTRWNARARSSGLDAQDAKLFAIGRWY